MAVTSRPVMAGPGRALPSGASKWEIREKVWEHLEASGLAEFPRPVRGRIPNFKGSPQACRSLGELDVFGGAREVKVDPDKPLEGARLAALQARKTLLVPTPRLRTGLFNRIVPPPGATKEILRRCATSQGVKDYSVPVGLDGKAQVDLVVVGSVAVSEKGKEKLPAEKSQCSVRKATPRGRDRFTLGAELCSWVVPLCVTDPCSPSQQEAAPGCTGHTAGGSEMFWLSGKLLRQAIICVLKESRQAAWSEICSAHTGWCVRPADSVPIWGSDFAFSSVLETCWC
uniref:Methenyltetrahydrofolate synthetase domain containing n=1 Tax=Ficedula albicollis TaxID=59894 RepID=A0A803V2T9_FICAL